MAAKRHHTVPRFFLSRFAAADGRVRVVDRDDPSKFFETGVEGALAQRHFYTVDTEQGPDTGVEEDLLAKHVEANGARALRRVVDEGVFPPMPGLRQALSIFFAFQFVRGPGMRDALLEQYDRFGKALTSRATPETVRKFFKQDDGSVPTDEEVQELLRDLHDTETYRIVPSDEASHHLLTVLPWVIDLVPHFERRGWQLMSFADPVLITGDEPIGLVGRSTRPGNRALGVGTASQIVIPVDPTHALILVSGDNEERALTGTPRMARIINNNIGYGCHRFIVHRPGTDPLRGLTFAAKGKRVTVKGNLLSFSPRPPRRRTRR